MRISLFALLLCFVIPASAYAHHDNGHRSYYRYQDGHQERQRHSPRVIVVERPVYQPPRVIVVDRPVYHDEPYYYDPRYHHQPRVVVVEQPVYRDRHYDPCANRSGVGTGVGVIAGAAIGHRVGGDLGTIIGALGGAMIGGEIDRDRCR